MKRDSRQVLTEWLVLTAQAGSEAAFKDLHDLWRADLRRLALVRIEHPKEADEVMTDVWLGIARNLSRLDDPACFPRWAFRIVERRCTDWIRQRSRARQRELAIEKEAEALAPTMSAMPATEEASDDVLALRAAIARLPVDQRELLHLFYELDLSITEIAEIIAIPPGTVKSRLFSIREALKLQLERKSP